jgi:predicted ArsR family transcriptional regulator
VGRPQHRYSLAPDAPSLGLEPPTMPMLARMVLSMADRLGASGADAEVVGHDEGVRRAMPYDDAPSSLEALVSDLDRLGFDPIVSEGDDDDTAVVGVRHCPFRRSPPSTPSSCAGCTAGSSKGSSPAWAMPRCASSARSCTAPLARWPSRSR